MVSDAALNRQLMETVAGLNRVIEALHAELRELREELALLRAPAVYQTDEDELAEETVVDVTSPHRPAKKRKLAETTHHTPPNDAPDHDFPALGAPLGGPKNKKHLKPVSSQPSTKASTNTSPARESPPTIPLKQSLPPIILSGTMDHTIVANIAKKNDLLDYKLSCGSNRTWLLTPADQETRNEIEGLLKSNHIYAVPSEQRCNRNHLHHLAHCSSSD